MTEAETLAEDIGGFAHDPLGFVLYAFDWGYGELADYQGPRRWQIERLTLLGERLRAGAITQSAAIRMAVSSGNGPGKSALVSWLILWALSTMRDSRVIVTANTEPQLKTKTWPEVGKWHRLMINKEWFTLTATTLYSNEDGHEKNWRCDMIPWNIDKPESFAGLHNKGRRILLIFDEASAIHDKIWETAEGALTDSGTEIIWLVCGNPTRNSGRFAECFKSQQALWLGLTLDASKVEGINQTQFQEWIATYGDDSDFVRVHVRGQFPRSSTMQFIESDIVSAAMVREPVAILADPIVMAIDVSRGGDDFMVFRFRRGKDARSIPPVRVPGADTKDSMKMVSLGLELIAKYKPDAVFLDATGVGGPLGDRFRQLGYVVMDVQFGSSSPDPHYANFRAYMYGKCREWLREGGAIDDSKELEMGLTGVEYTHNLHDKLVLERKELLKKRIGISPDDADALVMTFAYPVANRVGPYYDSRSGAEVEGKLISDWDPMEESRL